MGASRPELFRGRHFRDEIIVLCMRWYLRYPLSYRDLEEIMGERGVAIDHSTIARWVLRYAPVLNDGIRSEMRRPNRSWRAHPHSLRRFLEHDFTFGAAVCGGDEQARFARHVQSHKRNLAAIRRECNYAVNVTSF